MEESEESEEEEENEEIEQQNLNEKDEKFLDLNEESKNKRKSKKKENIEKLNISDFKEDPSLTIKDHNIIEECCVECNEKNIWKQITSRKRSPRIQRKNNS